MINYADHIEAVATKLLGKPQKISKTEWRYGNRGSLSIKLDGTWFDHESGEGGGVIDLICRERKLDKTSAGKWLAEFLNIPSEPTSYDLAKTGKKFSSKVARTHEYTDPSGNLLFEAIKKENGRWSQRRPDGKGGWIWNLKGVQTEIYRVTDVMDALAQDRPVFIVEGEKDVDRLWDNNVPATCNPMGARKWKSDFSRHFEDADVIIIPDNDEPGREHAEQVARSLQGKASRIRVLDLVDLPEKGDVSDWFDRGGNANFLNELAEHTPDWIPTQTTHFSGVWFGDEDKQPSMKWLVKGLLCEGDLSVLYGGPGSSKSFLALDMALHVAHGREWMGQKVTQGGVVYVSGEGRSGFCRRIGAWRREKIGEDGSPFFLLPQSLNLYDDDTHLNMLIEDIGKHAMQMSQPVKLIVLDTLSRMIGSGDEDKARDMNVVVQRIERLQRETGAHVLIVHHTGKDKDRGMRGSNALLGACDAAMEVNRFDTGLCQMRAVRLKDGEDGQTFNYELSKVVLGADEDGDEITSCVISETSPNAATPEQGSLSKDCQIAKQCLVDLVNDEAVQHVSQGVPPRASPGVIFETWRHACQCQIVLKSGVAGRQKWKRIKDRLIELRIIGTDNEVVWLE